MKGLAGLVLITCSSSKDIFCRDSDLEMLSALPLLLRNYRSHGLSSFLAVPSINVFCGYKISTSSSDPYKKIRQQPQEVVESLADTLELRAAEEQQTLLRERWRMCDLF